MWVGGCDGKATLLWPGLHISWRLLGGTTKCHRCRGACTRAARWPDRSDPHGLSPGFAGPEPLNLADMQTKQR